MSVLHSTALHRTVLIISLILHTIITVIHCKECDTQRVMSAQHCRSTTSGRVSEVPTLSLLSVAKMTTDSQVMCHGLNSRIKTVCIILHSTVYGTVILLAASNKHPVLKYDTGSKFTNHLKTILRQFSDLRQSYDNWRIQRTFTTILRPVLRHNF